MVGEMQQFVGEMQHFVGETKQFVGGNEANLLGKWSKWMGKWSKMCWGDAPKVKCSIPQSLFWRSLISFLVFVLNLISISPSLRFHISQVIIFLIAPPPLPHFTTLSESREMFFCTRMLFNSNSSQFNAVCSPFPLGCAKFWADLQFFGAPNTVNRLRF